MQVVKCTCHQQTKQKQEIEEIKIKGSKLNIK